MKNSIGILIEIALNLYAFALGSMDILTMLILLPCEHGVQFSSVQSLSHVRLCDTMNRSMPGLPVHHQLPESTQTHVYQVDDAIQPSNPLSSISPPALNLSQHQGLFQ